jgi:hypothetical protein
MAEATKCLVFSKKSSPAFGPTQLAIHWELGFFHRDIKHPGHEDNNSSQSSTKAKNK